METNSYRVVVQSKRENTLIEKDTKPLNRKEKSSDLVLVTTFDYLGHLVFRTACTKYHLRCRLERELELILHNVLQCGQRNMKRTQKELDQSTALSHVSHISDHKQINPKNNTYTSPTYIISRKITTIESTKPANQYSRKLG